MKVKILKCSADVYWYHDKIGQIFIVSEINSVCYRVNIKENNYRRIFKMDCIDVKELRLAKLKRILN